MIKLIKSFDPRTAGRLEETGIPLPSLKKANRSKGRDAKPRDYELPTPQLMSAGLPKWQTLSERKFKGRSLLISLFSGGPNCRNAVRASPFVLYAIRGVFRNSHHRNFSQLTRWDFSFRIAFCIHPTYGLQFTLHILRFCLFF